MGLFLQIAIIGTLQAVKKLTIDGQCPFQVLYFALFLHNNLLNVLLSFFVDTFNDNTKQSIN